MSENEKTEATKAVEAEEAATATEPTFLESLEAMKPLSEMHARGEDATETKDVEEVVEETEEEVEVEAEVEAAPAPVADAPFMVLADGTGVTKEEAVAGYMRHIDYTQKGMKAAEVAKENEQYKGMIEAMKNDKELLDKVVSHIQTKRDAPATTPAPAQTIELPDEVKDIPFYKDLITKFNDMSVRLAKAEGGVGAIKQEKVQSEEQAEIGREYEQRLQKSYKWLGERVKNLPTAEDFVSKIRQHFESKGMTPEQYNSMILGPDSDYLCAQVAEAFRADIGKVAKDKVSSEREKRQPKGAAKRALKATGKPPKAVSQASPKLPDGRLDRRKFFRESPVQKLSEEDMG